MENRKNGVLEEKLEKFQSLYGCEIFLTLPQWKRRLFSLRLVRKKNGFPEMLFAELEERNLKASFFLPPEKLEEYASCTSGNITYVPDLSADTAWTCEQLSAVRKKFEDFSGRLCCGAMAGENTGKEQYALLQKCGFSYAVTSAVSHAASPCLDAFALKNSSVNGDIPSDVLERFLKSDPYGGVLAHFSLLITDLRAVRVLQLLQRQSLCLTGEHFLLFSACLFSA